MKRINIIIVLSMVNLICFGQIIHVPADQPNIQAGINAATDGDTVLVENGIYFENIKFKGKGITVASQFIIDGDENHIENTIIDGSQAINPDSASCVMFVNLEDTLSIISGFSIRGGSGILNSTYGVRFGGGIACWESGPIIRHNIIINNVITETAISCGGAGIGSWSETGNWWIIIEDNSILNNTCTTNAESVFGGGIYISTNSIVRNNIVENNSCFGTNGQADGGGIEVQRLMGTTITTDIYGNLIQNNSVEGIYGMGGGITLIEVGGNIVNNLISNNEAIAVESAHGGGIYIDHTSGEIQIIGNEIINNKSIGNLAYGAGFRIIYPSTEILVKNNFINGNSCLGVNGSAGSAMAYYTPTAKIQILNNEIQGNASTGSNWSYGPVFFWDAENTEVLVSRNLFISNTAMYVGGLYTMSCNNITISNNQFSGNIAEKLGGAIFMNQHSTNSNHEEFYPEINDRNPDVLQKPNGLIYPLIINNTFFENYAGELGGAIYTTSSYDSLCPVILNNIFWNNISDSLGNDIRHGGSDNIFVAYNNIETGDIWGNWEGDNNIQVDPLLIDDSCHIDYSSECIEAGITSIEVNGETYHCPDFDIDGQMRPLNGTADIGLDEVLISGINEGNISQKDSELKISPNPSSGNIYIQYTIRDQGLTICDLYNISGVKVKQLLNEEKTTGTYEMEIDLKDLPNGVYFITLKTNKTTQSTKIIKL